jgi:hypothetical protein
MNRPVLYGEYPYYRAHPDHWEANLAALAEAGVDVVTCYVPWRFHEVGARRYDFTGAGDPQRDVRRLLRLVAGYGLGAVLKPGPFVHGEVQYGGLPDRVSEYTAVLGADGVPVTSQGLPLPSLHDERYRAEVRHWLAAVDAEVFAPALSPDGPIVAVQLGNEGIYSDGNLPVSAHDFAPPAIQAFAAHVQPEEAEVVLAVPATGWPAELRARWAEWSGVVLRDQYRWLAGCCPAARRVALVNLPLPRLDGAPASWLLRTARIGETGLAEGYTSWVGNASRSLDAFAAHWFGVRARRSANVEENWGFTWTDPSFAEPGTPLFHALLALALDSRSCSVYTACATAHWGPVIDLDAEALRREGLDPADYGPPYCPGAPLREDGTSNPNLIALHAVRDLLRGHGSALVAARFAADVTLVVSAGAVREEAWPEASCTQANGTLRRAIDLAVELMTVHQYRVDVLVDAAVTGSDPRQPWLVPVGPAGPDVRLRALVEARRAAGGTVIVLRNGERGATVARRLPAPRYAHRDSDPAVVLVHEDGSGTPQLLFAFNPGTDPVTVRRMVGGVLVELRLAPNSAALLRRTAGQFAPLLATTDVGIAQPAG